MATTGDCDCCLPCIESSVEGHNWDRKLNRDHARANGLAKDTRTRREHQGARDYLLWWPEPGPVKPKVRRREQEPSNQDNSASAHAWEEGENAAEQRTAARWAIKMNCSCCLEMRLAYRREALKEQRWILKMYESQRQTLGRTLGGNRHKRLKKPNWVDYEWNIELKDVTVEQPIVDDTDDDSNSSAFYAPLDLLDLIKESKPPKRRRETPIIIGYKSIPTACASLSSISGDWDTLSIGSIEHSVKDDEWDRLSDVDSVY